MASRFSVPLQALADKIKLDLETLTRKSTFDLFAKVNLRSPRDTGRFIANWNVSFGTPNVTYTDSTDIGRANREVAKALTLPLGGVTYMANGLPYAYELEKGHSNQAPRGMVEVSVIEFSDFVRKATA